MIQVHALTKNFGSFRAVDHMTFAVQPGEVLGFLGPNGAGKSTTMKMLTGYLPPSSGDAEICGCSILKDPIGARAKLGYLPESAPSYQEMLVEEFLRFAGEMRGFSGSDLQRRVDIVLEKTSLQDVRSQMIDTLSKGYRQRTCLAQALLHNPPVLLLDEPTDGLDPNQKHEVRNLIQSMRQQHTILVSTHILEEVEAVCSRALIIARGKLVGDGTPEELLSQSRTHNAISLRVKTADPARLRTALEQLSTVESVSATGETAREVHLLVYAKDRRPILEEVRQTLQALSLSPEELYIERGRLDEVFRQLTMQEAA